MKKLLSYLIISFLATQAIASSPNSRGMTSAGMNVSVEVITSSSIRESKELMAHINGERNVSLEVGSIANGRIMIPAQSGTEMLLRIQGKDVLRDRNNRSIHFTPQARIGRNVVEEKNLIVNGDAEMIRFLPSDNGGYRGIAELELFGIIDAGIHSSGFFKTTYTITTEHF